MALNLLPLMTLTLVISYPSGGVVKLWQALFLVAVVFGASASLSADPIDPGVQFNKGGNQSTDITCFFCVITLDAPINADGGGDFDIHNETSSTIFELIFSIPTTNFDQIFTASSNLFLNAVIALSPDTDFTTVTFFGTGNGPNASASAGPIGSCDDCAQGFEAGAFATVFAVPGPGSGNHPGLGPGDEGILGLDPSDVPEPGSFVLLLSAVALLAGSRKLYARHAKTRL